jgi:hypothetical protein
MEKVFQLGTAGVCVDGPEKKKSHLSLRLVLLPSHEHTHNSEGRNRNIRTPKTDGVKGGEKKGEKNLSDWVRI